MSRVKILGTESNKMPYLKIFKVKKVNGIKVTTDDTNCFFEDKQKGCIKFYAVYLREKRKRVD